MALTRPDSPSSSVALTPCADNGGSSSFVCGLNASACSSDTGVFTMSGGGSFTLRPPQVQALIEPVLSSASASATSQTTVTSCPSPPTSGGMYTAAQMAGLGCGLGLPLLFAIVAAGFFFMRERGWRRHSIVEPDSYTFRPPPTIQHPAFRSMPVSRDGSEVGSMQTMTTNGHEQQHLHSFLDRYQAMNEKTGRVPVHRVELDGSPVSHDRRREMGERATVQEGNRF